jgi:hypothetical protein
MAGLRQTVRDLLRSLSADETSSHRTANPWRISHKDAQERGIQFLTQNLSPTQRQQYERHGYFEVIGGDTGKRYRIWHGGQLNVEPLDPNAKRVRLCFMPRGRLPVGDIMLAQKIALELFETEAVKVACGSLEWDHLFEDETRWRRRVRR